jgi:hypothetical protein
MANKLEVEGKEILIKSSNGTMAVIPKDKVSMVKGYIDSGNHEMVDKFVGSLKEFKHDNQKAGDGLYANIHAKRERIAAGSGERMRKPGDAGAPTADQFKQAAKTAKAQYGMMIAMPMSAMNQKAEDGVKIVPPAVKKVPRPILSKPTTQDSLDLYNYYKLQKQIEKADQIRKSTPEEYEKTNQVFVLKKEGDEAKKKLDKLALEIMQRNKNIKPGTYPDENQVQSADIIKDGKKVTIKRLKFSNEQKIDNYLKSGSFDIYHPSIKPKGYWDSYAENNDYSNVNPVKPTPAPVKPEIIVPKALTPKAANYNFTGPDVVDNRKPEMVSIPKPAQKPPPAMQYPGMNQNLLEKLKSFITGKKEMPYWTDKQGDKHYPHLGESSHEEVKMIKMLKSGLNPKVKEDAAELKRIDMLLEMSRKDRLKKINPKAENGMMIPPKKKSNRFNSMRSINPPY